MFIYTSIYIAKALVCSNQEITYFQGVTKDSIRKFILQWAIL